MLKNIVSCLRFILLLSCSNFDAFELRSQSTDTLPVLRFPFLHEDISLLDFAEVITDSSQSEAPPPDILTRPFQPARNLFATNISRYPENTTSVWVRFRLANSSIADTTVSLLFPQAVSKAVLFKAENNRLNFIGKTGFIIAVLKRSVPYHHARIDIPLKGNTTGEYYVQAVLFNGGWMPVVPVLETFNYAEMTAFGQDIAVTHSQLLTDHIFLGFFFMFFVFGFIKYVVLGRDKAYLYYSLMGLSLLLLSLAQSEYPPLELPFFENLRGIELTNLLLTLTTVIHGLFILEILGLQLKYPRLTQAFKAYLLFKLLVSSSLTASWILFHKSNFLWWIETYDAMFYILLLLLWVIYLGRHRKGFYRFIFIGALTIFIASIISFSIRWFNLYYLLPSWMIRDDRTVVVRLFSLALIIDLIFYFTGLAYRDKEVEQEKIRFQQELITQLETNRQFQEKFTTQLEQQVKERTTEVMEEKAVVEKQKDVIQTEKDKSDKLLLNILPFEVAEELKEKGYTTAKAFEEVTILFSDIKGFTNVAESMTAQALVKEIDTYFSAFDYIMQEFGLEKIKTIGDAYIAAGGLPEQNVATVQNVVQAAVAMQQKVEELKKERQIKSAPFFELRIGIHTGPVVAGVVGIKKFQYDIWGDTVNLAARMEQSGVPGKINISQFTYEQVKGQFTCIHRGKVDAKNKGEMDMYFVEG